MKRLLLAALFGVSPVDEAGERELWVWAWERPEDLRFLPDDVGVAFLAETVDLQPGALASHPRRQPLRVRPEHRLTAVVRVEYDRSAPPRLRASTRAQLVQRVLAAASLPQVTGVQIDFDAALSQRGDYQVLLQDLRRALPAAVHLSITALASWCVFDGWDASAADEVVPMLFTMGPAAGEIRRWLGRTGALRESRCRRSAGVMYGESLAVPAATRRVFVFNRNAWTRAAFDDVRGRLQ